MVTTLLNLTENAALRGMKVEAEGVEEKEKWWFSVYDFVNFVCDKDPKGPYAKSTFQRLIKNDSEYAKEVDTLCIGLKFAGRGQQLTPCMTIRGLQRLLMILGGKVAAEYRAIAEGVMTRYLAGDTTLLAEIRANAASNTPLNQACRAALEQEPVTGKRKEMEDLEISERQAKLADMHVKTQENGIKNQENSIKNIHLFAETMAFLDADWKQDARLVRQTKDLLQNAVNRFGGGGGGGGGVTQPAIEGPAPTSYRFDPAASITVSGVAQAMGVRLQPGDAAAIGKAAKRAYAAKHGVDPERHKQWVDGAERLVCSYTEADRSLLEEAVQAHERAQSTRSKSDKSDKSGAGGSGGPSISLYFNRLH
jgi:hypothetical protein